MVEVFHQTRIVVAFTNRAMLRGDDGTQREDIILTMKSYILRCDITF